LTADLPRGTISGMPRLTIELTQRQIEFLQEQARETNLAGPEDAAARVIDSVERLGERTSLSELLREAWPAALPMTRPTPRGGGTKG